MAVEIYLVWDPYYVTVHGYKNITHWNGPEVNELTESRCRFLNLLVECGYTAIRYSSGSHAYFPPLRLLSSRSNSIARLSQMSSNMFGNVEIDRLSLSNGILKGQHMKGNLILKVLKVPPCLVVLLTGKNPIPLSPCPSFRKLDPFLAL